MAIKKIRCTLPPHPPPLSAQRPLTHPARPFEHKLFCQRTLREIRILKVMKHPNIIEITNLLGGEPGAADVCVSHGGGRGAADPNPHA